MPKKCLDTLQTLDENDRQLRQQLFYVLLGTEIDSVRSKINVLPEITGFEDLVKLGQRAAFLARQTPDCLPSTPKGDLFTQEFNEAFVGDGQIVAGAVALATADRMFAIGTSSGEQERAIELRRNGERWLRDGYVELRPVWRSDVRKLSEPPLAGRLFNQSRWEASANLASRVIARLQ